jgi:hypothetical protein
LRNGPADRQPVAQTYDPYNHRTIYYA